MLLADMERRPARRALADFMVSKGALRAYEAVLCVCTWLEREQTAERDAGVSGAEIERWYPSHGGRRLRGTATMLRRLTSYGLVERLDGGRYRATPLGHRLVDALPARDIAIAVIGTRPPSARRVALASA